MSTQTQKTYRGVITHWQLHHLSYPQETLDQLSDQMGQERILPLIITGTVKEDPTCRMEAGWHIRTSPLTFFDEENGNCETRNSAYHLEGPNGSDTFPDMGDQVMKIVY